MFGDGNLVRRCVIRILMNRVICIAAITFELSIRLESTPFLQDEYHWSSQVAEKK